MTYLQIAGWLCLGFTIGFVMCAVLSANALGSVQKGDQ